MSSESGVGEDTGSTEALSKIESPQTNGVYNPHHTTKFSINELTKPVGSIASDCPITNQTDPQSSSAGQQLLSSQSSSIFYTPTMGHWKASNDNGAITTLSQKQPIISKDFDSDCSDSSVEVIRIVTRL